MVDGAKSFFSGGISAALEAELDRRVGLFVFLFDIDFSLGTALAYDFSRIVGQLLASAWATLAHFNCGNSVAMETWDPGNAAGLELANERAAVGAGQ